MATIPLSAARGAILDIVTICKADHWLDDVLPRFAALVDANCSGTVRRHLLLLTAPETPAEDEGRLAAALLARGWYSVVCESPTDAQAGRRLLLFDSLRARLPGTFGLRECLYMDPDTDVVADLQGIQAIAPDADRRLLAAHGAEAGSSTTNSFAAASRARATLPRGTRILIKPPPSAWCSTSPTVPIARPASVR